MNPNTNKMVSKWDYNYVKFYNKRQLVSEGYCELWFNNDCTCSEIRGIVIPEHTSATFELRPARCSYPRPKGAKGIKYYDSPGVPYER